MILVDTCVWIDFLKKKQTPACRFLEESIYKKTEIVTNHIIYFELLRGISSELERRRVRKYLLQLAFCDYSPENFDQLISFYRKCLSQGLNLPKLGDWLILKSAIDFNLSLLTSDKGFYKLHEILSFNLIKL